MKTKIELKRTNGEIFFSHECEDNSVVKTIEALRTIDKEFDFHCADLWNADLSGANLSGADLRNADLRDADLRDAYLRDAYLRDAYLRDADLRDAYLSGAYLSGADLRYADLRDADLSCADLWNADLSGADLRNADLRNTDLRNAYLWNADLRNADLRNADLRGADLRDADLSGADLSGADLRNADLNCADLSNINVSEKTAFLLQQCPSEGSFIAWKKAGGKIVKLLVTDDAKRSSATTLKCRCSKAKVLAIENIDGSESELKQVASSHDDKFIYRVGETVEVENFDENRWNECSTGIHFFIARELAVKY